MNIEKTVLLNKNNITNSIENYCKFSFIIWFEFLIRKQQMAKRKAQIQN